MEVGYKVVLFPGRMVLIHITDLVPEEEGEEEGEEERGKGRRVRRVTHLCISI